MTYRYLLSISTIAIVDVQAGRALAAIVRAYHISYHPDSCVGDGGELPIGLKFDKILNIRMWTTRRTRKSSDAVKGIHMGRRCVPRNTASGREFSVRGERRVKAMRYACNA